MIIQLSLFGKKHFQSGASAWLLSSDWNRWWSKNYGTMLFSFTFSVTLFFFLFYFGFFSPPSSSSIISTIPVSQGKILLQETTTVRSSLWIAIELQGAHNAHTPTPLPANQPSLPTLCFIFLPAPCIMFVRSRSNLLTLILETAEGQQRPWEDAWLSPVARTCQTPTCLLLPSFPSFTPTTATTTPRKQQSAWE